jgi:hypothetical protein
MCCCCCFCCDPVVFASSVVFLAREKTEFPFLSGGKGLVFDRFQQPGASRGAAGHHRGARGRKDENLSFRYYYHLPIEKRMYHAATQYTQYIIPQSCRVDSISLLIYYCTRVPGYCTVRYHIYSLRVSLSYCTVRLELLCFEQVWSSVVALRPGDGVPSILLLSHFFLKNENTDLCPLGTGFCAIFAFFFAGP